VSRDNARSGSTDRRSYTKIGDRQQLINLHIDEEKSHLLSPFKDRLSGQQLSQDAANRPHVNRRSLSKTAKPGMGEGRISPNPRKGKGKKSAFSTTHIIRKAEHDLGRAVPPRRDVLGHEALLLRLVEPAREPEIANLEFAVRVHEQVAGLEIAVQHVGRVDVFQAAERLVDEGLEVRVRQGLTRTDLRELEGKKGSFVTGHD